MRQYCQRKDKVSNISEMDVSAFVKNSYLVFNKHSSEAIEELEWRDDVTLNKH